MRCVVLFAVLIAGLPAANSENPQVRLLTADGTLFGVLQVSHGGEALSLSQPDGSVLEVGSCSDEQKAKVPSPDGTRDAVVVERNCGATVDFATRVGLGSMQGLETLVVFAGQPQLKLVWQGGAKLVVHHSKLTPDQVYSPVTETLGVAVTFVADLRAALPTEHLDFSSLNYGATGRAAGMPGELLLRLAGWSQEASGLHRTEWGTWAGQPPYGDDPRGAAKVIEGIDYFEKVYSKQR